MPLTSLPNLLTVSRILAIPVVIGSFYVSGDYARWFACALFSAAALTDWPDSTLVVDNPIPIVPGWWVASVGVVRGRRVADRGFFRREVLRGRRAN